MDISIIIPTYERDHILNKTLESVLNSTFHLESEIIVVNDSKKHFPIIPSGYSNVKVLNNPYKGGASARNFGAKCSVSNFLIFIDDDFLITKESIDRIIEYLKKYPYCAFNVAWEYPSSLYKSILKYQFGRYLTHHLNFTSLKGILGKNWKEREMFLHPSVLGSGFFAITKSSFFKANGYNERLTFAEDGDLSRRLRSADIAVYILPAIKVYHNEEDKVSLIKFLERRKYGIRKAVEYEIISKVKYTKTKSIILSVLSSIKPLIFFVMYIIPNKRILDYIYNKLADLLFVIYLYEGYTKKD